MLPAELQGQKNSEQRARDLLAQVGLSERLRHFPSQLSGGEQQRVAIARAFITQPDILLADEPTGNLDTNTGAQIIELLFELNRTHGTTLLMVSHDESLAARCDRRLVMTAGVWRNMMPSLGLGLLGLNSSLGFGLVWREIGRGPLRLFLFALALSVASILSVTLVADRLNQALSVSGRDYIAADRVLSSTRALEKTWLTEAQAQGLRCRALSLFKVCCLPMMNCSWPAYAPWIMPFRFMGSWY